MSRVLVVGDIVTDILAVHSGSLSVDSDTPARVTIGGGGAAANTAAWLAHLGTPVSLLGAVGEDAAGRERVAELERAGVDCSCVVRAPAPTGSVIVLTDGQHRTMVTDRGANHDLRPSHVDAALAALADATHLHLSGYTLLDATSREAGLHALSRFGGSTSVDAASAAPLRHAPAFLDWVRGAALLLANLDEARVMTATPSTVEPEAVAAALATVVPEVVVKLGAGGAVWAGAGGVRRVPARPATVADTTGAGDAFAAGLLAARLAGAPLDAGLAQAVRLGAEAVGILGGRPATVPRRR